jgi:hypothetical protein
VSRGRKVKRHACSVIGTQQYRRMEGSCASAPLVEGPKNIEAAGKAGERETNAPEPLASPEAAGRWETKEPCSMETAKSMGARETNVPEERSAAVRRAGEPLANAAVRRPPMNTKWLRRSGPLHLWERSRGLHHHQIQIQQISYERQQTRTNGSQLRQRPAAERPRTEVWSSTNTSRKYSVRRQERC